MQDTSSKQEDVSKAVPIETSWFVFYGDEKSPPAC